ncbi:MAG: glycosyltransferase family 25 protein [Verrucomicrobiota bacterium]
MGVSSDNSAAGSVDSPINAQRDGVAAVIGYFPGGRWREFAEQYARLILVDQFQIHAGSEDALVEADRRMLCRLFEEDGSNADGIEKFGESGSRETNLIPDGSLELLYISGEVSPASLYVALPYWLPKVRDGGTICGDAYGYLHSPDTTYTIALLIGVPENVDHRGRWKKSHRAGARLFLPMEGSHAKKCDGVLLVGGETGSLLLSAHAIRKHWNGPVHLWHQGPGDESLRIVCNRLGMDFVPISPAIVPVSELLNNDAISVPFDRTLILKPGHLLIGPPQFDMVTKALLLDESGPMIAVRERGRVDFRQAASVLASRFIGRENASIIVSDGEPEGWSEAAWEMWCELETEATLSNVTDVRVAPGVTVVTIVTPEEAGDFQRNWLSWRFRAAEALVLLVDMDIDTFWIPQSEKARVLAVTEKQAADMAWLFALIARESANRRLLFVSPEASALPGAELWPDLTGAWRAVHFSPQARTSAAMTGNAFFPKACFALVHKDDLQEIASRAESSLPGEMARVFCEWAVSREKVEAKIRFSNVAGMGWRFPAIHHWKEGSGKSTQPAGHLLVTRGDGLIQLADDVVIITLPERFDRQRRIADMMNRENLWFRFVEGVRVTDKEIDPAEISEVRRQKFKVVAGFEKYLRGMVGCRRAHLRELELAKEKNLRSLLIIEDDMALEPGWLRTLQSAIKDLPAGWFQLHFSANEFRASAPVSSHLHRLSGARQTTAILYSRTGIGAALNCLRHSRLEIDQWMGDHLHPFGNSYVMNPQIAHQQGGVSDIMGFDRGITA